MTMLRKILKRAFIDDLRALRAEIEAYSEEADLWRRVGSITNSAGNLALHQAGAIRYLAGHVLGGIPYHRDRAAEFSRTDVPRTELLEGIDTAIDAVRRTFDALADTDLDRMYPEDVGAPGSITIGHVPGQAGDAYVLPQRADQLSPPHAGIRRLIAATMRIVLCVSVLLLFTGCAGDAQDGMREAANVPAGTPVRIDLEPQVVVGVVRGDPHEEFDGVTTPFLLPDGSVAVPTAGQGEIRIFDQAGEFVAAYGGAGEGPGEFRRLGGAWARGDTIEALDVALERITRFLPDGRTEVVRLNGPRVMWAVGPIPDGWILFSLSVARDNPRDQLVVHRFDRHGEHVGAVAHVEGIARVQLPGRVAAALFSPSARFDVQGDEVFIAETLTPEIRVNAPDGTFVRRIVWEPESITAPGDALDQVQTVLQQDARAEQAITQALLRVPLPDRIPLFSDILVDGEGFVWVRPYVPVRDAVAVGGNVAVHRNSRGGEWLVFDGAGERVASIVMPPDLEPSQITSDAVVGIARDELGVERVRVHSLIRR